MVPTIFLLFLNIITFFVYQIDCKLVNLTDLSQCKVSHLGMEFRGTISYSGGRLRCQRWSAEKPVHVVNKDIKDSDFPEQSLSLANNYCRNPERRPKGPWCYTMDPGVIDDSCDIPLCGNILCKLTGPGMEYSGKHEKSVTDRKCKRWNKTLKKIKQKAIVKQGPKFEDWRFVDKTRRKADNHCRNPDGDIGGYGPVPPSDGVANVKIVKKGQESWEQGRQRSDIIIQCGLSPRQNTHTGPWCFVETDEADDVFEKDYCDIPFCDDQDCMLYSSTSGQYTHYTHLNGSLRNVSFAIKTWDPDTFLTAEARLVLTVLPLPARAQQLETWGIGIEILISNNGSMVSSGAAEVEDISKDPSPGILSSTKYTNVWLSWGAGFISMGIEGKIKPIFINEYREKKTILNLEPGQFLFYSLHGTNVLWSFPFCDEDDYCDVHVTHRDDFTRYWPIRKGNTSHDITFHVRAHHSALLRMKQSPTVEYPRVTLMIQAENNDTKVILEYGPNGQTLLKSATILNIINYWEFEKFSVSIFGHQLQLFWAREIGTQTVLDLKHDEINKLRWFSPGSKNTEAHWSLYCEPNKEFHEKAAWPPDCAISQAAEDYSGSQSVTREGFPCIPWSAKEIPNNLKVDSLYGDKTVLDAKNFCRNPTKDKAGPYCYVISWQDGGKIEKKYCQIRNCKAANCKSAGTGNDFIGKLSTTRSNRTCQYWTSNTPHRVNKTLLNETLYADRNLSLIKNYCRDPSRNAAGPWCYTTDPKVPYDMCDVEDCSKPEECTILIKEDVSRRYTFMLPEWKQSGIHFSLKEWNPDKLDGICIRVYSLDFDYTFTMYIGAKNSQKIIVMFSNPWHTMRLIEKTLPRMIPAGKWGNFWLHVFRGHIRLGYEGNPFSLFEWSSTNESYFFDPVYINFNSLAYNFIGVSFRCDECHTEHTSMYMSPYLMPINIWKTKQEIEQEKKHSYNYKNVTLHLRGTGVAVLPFVLLPGDVNHYQLSIGEDSNNITFYKKGRKKSQTIIVASTTLNESVMKTDKWIVINIIFNETRFTIIRDGINVLTYIPTVPLLLYWFSFMTATGYGWITWSVNCVPPDIDGPPLNGGWSEWSPWECTVSCGGGDGVRTRRCDNPKPNVYGTLCNGPLKSTGRCNEFECGDISPQTEQNITTSLQTELNAYIVAVGEDIRLTPPEELLKDIKRESPKATFKWTLNGIFLKFKHKDAGRYLENGNTVVIKDAKLSDSGIYLFMMYRVTEIKVVLKVISVAVNSKKPQIVTRVSYPLIMRCHGVVLGYIYNDLSLTWFLNDTVYKDYGITSLAAVNAENIPHADFSHSGKWRCEIKQDDLNLTWVTNIIHVLVKKKPTFLTHIMEDKLSGFFFGWMGYESVVLGAIVFIVVLVILCVAGWTYLFIKHGHIDPVIATS